MELLTDKVIYHVETQEDYDDLMEKLDELGCKWWYGGVCTSLNYFRRHGENTAIRVGNKKIVCSPLSYYIDNLNTTYKDHQLIKYKKDNKEQNPMKVKLKADQRFIADWYEESKDDLDYAIYLVLSEISESTEEYIDNDELLTWFNHDKKNKPLETLFKMHLFGYEIEKEPLYYVEIPNPNSEAEVKDYHLAKTTDGRVVIQKRNDIEIKENWKLTESEIKKDFAWAWDFAREV